MGQSEWYPGLNDRFLWQHCPDRTLWDTSGQGPCGGEQPSFHIGKPHPSIRSPSNQNSSRLTRWLARLALPSHCVFPKHWQPTIDLSSHLKPQLKKSLSSYCERAPIFVHQIFQIWAEVCHVINLKYTIKTEHIWIQLSFASHQPNRHIQIL